MDQGKQIFDRFWPEARAVSDEELQFYRRFGLERGGLGRMFSPGALAAGLRATLKGQTIGKPVGDVWIMPGLFAVAPDGRTLWSHLFEHVGDHPDFAALPRLWNAETSSGTP